jgi:Pentapeptide repeats (9 copies)
VRGLAAAWVLAVRRGPWRAPAARVGVSVGGWSRRPRGLPAVRALHGWLEIRSGAQGNRSEASQGDQELPGPWPVTWQVQQAPAGRAREPAGQAEQAASEGFQGIAFFEGATFQGEAGFSAATFQDLARFRKATFQGIVLFN